MGICALCALHKNYEKSEEVFLVSINIPVMRNPDKTKKHQLSTIQKTNQRNEMQAPLKQQLHAHPSNTGE